MSKITLDDGAQIVVESIDCLLLNDANYEDEAETLHQIAALIRAAQKVIDAAETYYTRYAKDEAEEDMGYTKMHLDAVALRDTLTTFRKLEEGE